MAAIQTILERLLVPDNAVIQQATRDLQAVYRNPEVIPSLCTLLHSSPNPQASSPSLPVHPGSESNCLDTPTLGGIFGGVSLPIDSTVCSCAVEKEASQTVEEAA
jgi:hypothetical protein